MLDEYTNDVNLLIKWFERAKEVTIKAESLDTQNTGYIQPLHEQRYCLDHFIRALVYDRQEDKALYTKKAISSAIGHLQRAYSDSIEWILVSVKDEYQQKLAKYSKEQVSIVFPDYYNVIRPSIEEITDLVNNYKINKSIERASTTDILSEDELKELSETTEQFLSMKVVEKLEGYYKDLHNHESQLIEARQKDRKKFIMEKILLPIGTAIAGGLIVALIMS